MALGRCWATNYRVGISTSRQTQFFKTGMDGVIGGGVQGWGPRTTFWKRPLL